MFPLSSHIPKFLFRQSFLLSLTPDLLGLFFSFFLALSLTFTADCLRLPHPTLYYRQRLDSLKVAALQSSTPSIPLHVQCAFDMHMHAMQPDGGSLKTGEEKDTFHFSKTFHYHIGES